MKFIKKLVLVCIVCISYVLVFCNSDVNAMSQSEAGQYIAEFALNFFNGYADQTIYSWDENQRGQAYIGNKTSGVTKNYGAGRNYTDKYAMDCVGFVSFAIHNALGIDSNITEDGIFYYFVVPTSCSGTDTSIMEKVTGDIKPGDILVNNHHVMVYIGNDTIVHSAGTGINWTISKDSLSTYGSINRHEPNLIKGTYTVAYRIKDSVANKINESSATTIFNAIGGISGIWVDSELPSGENSLESFQNARIVDVNDKLPLFKHLLLTEKYNFNNIKWERYGHGYDGEACEMQENLSLGLKYPKDESNTTLAQFVEFALPYLQTWMVPLSMHAGALTQGKSTESVINPMFTYSVIKDAMSDILVHRYDLTTTVLTTRYRDYDVVQVTEHYDYVLDDDGEGHHWEFVSREREVIDHISEQEEDVRNKVDIEPSYYIAEVNSLDLSVKNTFEYVKYSDTDVRDRVEGGVGYVGKETSIGEPIYVKNPEGKDISKASTVVYNEHVGNYIYIDRTWRDELNVVKTVPRTYTVEDVIKSSGATEVEQSALDDEEENNIDAEYFTSTDYDYYGILKVDNSINKIDLMNSNPDNYFEYLKDGTQYSAHVGYSREYLTYSYTQLKKMFREYFPTGTVPFFYGNSLGYNAYLESNEINAENVNIYNKSANLWGNIASISSHGSLQKDGTKKNILIIAGHFTEDREVPGTSGFTYTEALQNRKFAMELAGALDAAGMNAVIANRVMAYEKGTEDAEDKYGVIWGDYAVNQLSSDEIKRLFSGYDHVIEIHHNADQSSAYGALLVQSKKYSITDLDEKLLQCVVDNNMNNKKRSPITSGIKDMNVFYEMGNKITYLEMEFYTNNEAMEYIDSRYKDIAVDMAMTLREHFGINTPMNLENYESFTAGKYSASTGNSSYEWDIGGLKTFNYSELPGEEIEFELSFYCGVDNAMEGGPKGTHGNYLVYGNVASNYWSGMSSQGGWHNINNGRAIGTKIYLDGVGLFTVEDRGGSYDFNTKNRIDVFVARKEGESDAEYEKRTNSYGHVKIKGKVLPVGYSSHQHSYPDTSE